MPACTSASSWQAPSPPMPQTGGMCQSLQGELGSGLTCPWALARCAWDKWWLITHSVHAEDAGGYVWFCGLWTAACSTSSCVFAAGLAGGRTSATHACVGFLPQSQGPPEPAASAIAVVHPGLGGLLGWRRLSQHLFWNVQQACPACIAALWGTAGKFCKLPWYGALLRSRHLGFCWHGAGC